MQNDSHATDVLVPASTAMQSGRLGYYVPEEEQIFQLRDYLHVLLKRKWWVLGVFLSAVIAVTCIILLMTPVYLSTTTLQIIQDNPSALLGGANTDPLGALTGSSELDRFYETQYKILQSPTLAYGLIDSLNLQEHPSYKQMEKANPDTPPDILRQAYAQSLLKGLKVELVKKSFLVNISFSSTDKNLAQKIPEAIQSEYLKLSMTTRQQSYTMLREWLDGELDRLGKKLEISERNVYESGQQKDFLSLEEGQYNVTVQKYVELSKMLTVAQSEKAIKEANYRQIHEKGVDAPLITNHALIGQLRQQLIDLESQVSGSSRIFGSNYPEYQAQSTKMKELRDRLNKEVKRLEASIKADFETASRAEALLQKDFDLQKAKVIDLQNGLVQHHILKRDLQTNQTLYEGLLARMKEANIASTMVSSNVSVITRAETPNRPIKPKPIQYLAIAMLVGALGGVMLAFFVEYLDNSIKNTDELERISRLPALGLVPLADSKEGKLDRKALGLITHYKPSSVMSEAFFHIRTAIMFSSSEKPPQVLTITSANPDEGKTVTAVNIAVTLSGRDRKCLILDCDLRKPRVHNILQAFNKPDQCSNGLGLTHYLTGNAKLEEIIHTTQIPSLFFIPAGPKPPNPNELISSTTFEAMINRLRKEFDHIVIDSPPVIGFADARSISTKADGTVLVVKHNCTTIETGRHAVQLLSQNNIVILGCILTMARKDRMGYGSYYQYYHYYHKYYRSYHENGDKHSKI